MPNPEPIGRPAITSVRDALRYGTSPRHRPSTPKTRFQWANEINFARSLRAQAAVAHAAPHALAALGHLWLARVTADGEQIDLGLAGCRVVTTAGVNYIVDAFQNLVELEALRYHGLGTSSTPELVSNTTLGAELSTQYATNNIRGIGTLGEQSGLANVYETTALVTVDAAVTVTEHGVFSRAATGGGVLFDRTVFTGLPLASGDSLQCTYQFTMNAGG